MSIKKTDVLGNLVYASVSMACANEIPGYNGTLFAISEETKERIEADLVAARAAVAELIEAGKAMPTFTMMHECDCETCTAIVRFNAALVAFASAS